MNNIFKVYALIDFDDSVKYIGITSKDIVERLRQHINSSLKKEGSLTIKEAWIKNRIANGKKIDIALLEDKLTKEDAIELEISYISAYGMDNLKNSTLGGEGLFGYKYTPEQLSNWYNLKPISEYDLSGKLVKEFNSITEAAKFYNFNHSSVAYCVSNKNITCFNKIFVHRNKCFLAEKLERINKKNYFLYDIKGNLVDADKSLHNLYKKYGLTQRVNEFSKRVWNGFVPEIVKSDYFITTPNTDSKVILERINIFHLYTNDGMYVKSFARISHIAEYLKCSYTAITEHTRGRLNSVKGHMIIKNGKEPKEYVDSRKRKVACYKNGNIIDIFDSIKNASESLMVDQSCISKCCQGKRKSTKGYEFRYVNDIV